MVLRTATKTRWVAGLTAAALVSAPSAQAASHVILMTPDIKNAWVALKLKAALCPANLSLADTTRKCPSFRPVSHTGEIPLVENLIYIFLLNDAGWCRVEHFVDPHVDVLPKGGPIELVTRANCPKARLGARAQ